METNYYVTMTDKFMSGWGMAANKTNKLIIECKTYKQAIAIEREAKDRDEMIYVNIRSSKPYYGRHILPSFKTFEDLGQIWKRYYKEN